MIERLKLLSLVALGFAAGYVVGVLHLGGQLEREHAHTTASLRDALATQATELEATRAELERLQELVTPAAEPDPVAGGDALTDGEAAPVEPLAPAAGSEPADAPPPESRG